MNEAQALRIIRNTLRLENLSTATVRSVQPLLREALALVARRILQMDVDPTAPGNTLFRQVRWRTMRAQLQAILTPYNDALGNALIETLAREIPQQVRHAERLLLDAGIEPYQRASLASPGTGEVALPPGLQIPVGAGGGTTLVGSASIAPAQLVRAAADTRVLGTSLSQLFNVLRARPPVYPPQYGSEFIAEQIRTIDRVVKQGFLLGETNEEIARRLLSTGGARLRQEADTISRTAVMQMAHDAHAAEWDANQSVIAGFEYDATMDYRLCPICAPWDGRTARTRSELPAVPQHPRCRCSLLPLTETEVRLREERGPQRRTVVELVPYDGLDSKPTESANRRVYARPVTVKGKRYWRVARDILQRDHPLTTAEWLQRTSAVNRAAVLGSQKRAEVFLRRAQEIGPESALVEVTNPVRSRPSIAARRREPRAGMGASARVDRPPRVRRIPRVRRSG